MLEQVSKSGEDTAGYAKREIAGTPSSERVRKRLDELWNSDLYLDSERCRLYTEYIKDHWSELHYTRQGGALKHVLSGLTPVMRDGELIVGCLSRYTRGAQLYPEYNSGWIREALQGVKRVEDKYVEGYVPEDWKEETRLGIYKISPEDKQEIERVLQFWEKDWASISKELLKEQRDDYALVEKWAEQLLIVPFMWDVPEGRVIPD